ncbi:hypothetical protein IFM89_021411 [Coptis chinensis]|uniref:Uncharacterized protein n=1 Tax=Coptis chinensis TaxID=261450 RepID=A0A835M8W2_9MAGN|nr:hypothetical protein IFM89_021411 [Coptis chinensis]
MSSCSTDVSASEQVCYIPCNFCNIMLAVSVPCSSLYDTVTVRCGHCTNLWSVNMAAALQSFSWQELQRQSFPVLDHRIDQPSSTAKETSITSCPPGKRPRVPSAYNQFIKEEIQRIKANHPDISHRQAFSAAAKNWAHFPHIQFGLMLEANNKAEMNEGPAKHLMTTAALFNN